jgi:hypothetical protein
MMRPALASLAFFERSLDTCESQKDRKHAGQERIYESTWAHEDIFSGLNSLRLVVSLSVR